MLFIAFHSKPPPTWNQPFKLQVNLVDWLKNMVGKRRAEEVVDPKLPDTPAPKALKRVLLVALRCVDPDATKRPKMGNVLHMLEADDLLFHDVCCFPGDSVDKNFPSCHSWSLFFDSVDKMQGRQVGEEPSSSNRDYQRVGNKQMFEGASESEASKCDGSRDYLQPTRWR